MKLRNIASFKFFKPCKKILQLFKFRLRIRPLCIRPLHSRRRKPNKIKNKRQLIHKGCVSKMQSFFHSLRQKREITGRVPMIGFSDHRAPQSSPLTPAYVRMSGVPSKRDQVVILSSSDHGDDDDDDGVEDACRRFEEYLIEMIGEDGKMRDLVDAEELLHCWKNLKSPVYVDLVCRFYGELCKDLFSNGCDDQNGVVGTPKLRGLF